MLGVDDAIGEYRHVFPSSLPDGHDGGITGAFRGCDMDAVIARERELMVLTEAFLRAQSGNGGAVLVEGDAGMGKTTLLEAFRAAIASEGAAHQEERAVGLATGTCFELAAGQDSYEPFKEMLRELASPRQRAGYGRLVFDLVKETAPDLLSLVPGLGAAGAAAKIAFRSADVIEEWSLGADEQTRADLSESVAHQYADAFIALADNLAPLVLILEDAQWIDRASAQLFFRLAKAARGRRLLLILSYRPSYLEGAPLAAVLRELIILSTSEVVSLQGFSESQIKDYLERRYDTTSYDRGLPSWLKQLSGGSPMFVAQYLSLLEDEGLLRRTVDGLVLDRELKNVGGEWRVGYTDDLPVPRTVKELLAQRIEKLEERERRLLELGSVQGLRFMSVVLMSMVSATDEDLLRELRRIEREDRVIREEVPEPWARRVTGTYSFQHSLFRQAFYGELGRRERQNYHDTVAQTLVELLDRLRGENGEQPRRLVLEIVHHMRCAEDYRGAAHYGLQAAQSCYSEGAFGEVAALTRGVLADLAKADVAGQDDLMYAQAVRMLLATSEPQWFLARNSHELTVEELLTRASAAARRAGDAHLEAQLLFLSGRSQVVTGDLPRAVEILERAGQRMNELGDPFGEVSAMVELGHHQMALDPSAAVATLRSAQQRLDEARTVIEGQVPPQAVARIGHRVHGTIGIAAFDHGRFDEALEGLEPAVQGFSDGRMTDLYLLYANFLAQVLVATGQFERAERLLQDAIRAGGSDPVNAIPTAYNRALLGKLYVEWERFDLALAPLQTAWSEIQRTPDNSIFPLVANYYAELLLARPSQPDELVDAAAVLDWSLSHSRTFGFERSAITAQCLQARLALTREDLPTALAVSAQAAEALWKARVMPAVRAEEIYLTHGNALSAGGRDDAAAVWMSRAKKVLSDKAATLSSETLRRQFLERVPTSRSVMQAAR